MKVLFYEVDMLPSVEETNGNLSDMQEFVGGYVETVWLGNDFLLLCNEDGKNMGLQPNRTVIDTKGNLIDLIAGNFVICKNDLLKGDWVGLEDEDIAVAKALIPQVPDKEVGFALSKWSEEQKKGSELPCPRCGGAMNSKMIANCLSRYCDIFVCSNCGTHESFVDMLRNKKEKYPLIPPTNDYQNWVAVQYCNVAKYYNK